MEQMNITSAQYLVIGNAESYIKATVDGEVLQIPLDPANRHYAEIMRQVEAGTLTIQDAD